MAEHAVDVLLRDSLVGAAVDDDIVLAGGVHLDDGMAGHLSGHAQMVQLHAAVGQHLLQLLAALAQHAGVVGLRPRTGQGHRLVEPLSAAEVVQLAGGDGLPRRDKMLHLIHVVHVHGTEIQQPHGHSSLLFPPGHGVFSVGTMIA